MIKTYTSTVKAEQFDGSDEMMDKYEIKFWTPMLVSSSYHLKTLEGDLEVNLDDWIATGVNGEHWAIANDVFKKTYVEVK